jgi:hypothetical protein
MIGSGREAAFTLARCRVNVVSLGSWRDPKGRGSEDAPTSR